jgi:hypothetical protein
MNTIFANPDNPTIAYQLACKAVKKVAGENRKLRAQNAALKLRLRRIVGPVA